MTCKDCDRPVKARGLCEPHYRQVLRAERPKDPESAREQRRAALARGRATQTMRAVERLGELAWLIDGGEWPPRAVERVGWTLTGAEKAARTHGRRDISTSLWEHISREKRAA